MSLSIDWVNKIINVPKAYLTEVSDPYYEMDLNQFRLDLRNLEDDEEGIPFPKTHEHNTTITLGGITFADMIQIINGYTVTFEDGQYAVTLEGGNSNVSDVINFNQVSVRSKNSAGLIVVTQGSGITEQDKDDIVQKNWDRILTAQTHNIPTSAGRRLRQLGDVINGSVSDSSPTTTMFTTSLTGYGDDHFNNQYLRFIDGNLAGQVRIIDDYTSTTGKFCFCSGEAWTEAPADGDEFELIPVHLHTIDETSGAIWEEKEEDHQNTGTYGLEIIRNIKQLKEGNKKYEYYAATVQNDARNVAVGQLDYVIIKIKNDSDSNWDSPISTQTLYMWYAVLGDSNPIYVGESD